MLISPDYPTVPVGSERLRITPSPLHTVEQKAHLIASLNSVWNELGLKREADYALEGGRAGVGAPGAVVPDNLWTAEQLGLADEFISQAAEIIHEIPAAGSQAQASV